MRNEHGFPRTRRHTDYHKIEILLTFTAGVGIGFVAALILGGIL